MWKGKRLEAGKSRMGKAELPDVTWEKSKLIPLIRSLISYNGVRPYVSLTSSGMSVNTLTQYDIDRILSYLELPSATELPTTPLRFLSDHITVLPPPLLQPFDEVTSPRERTAIPAIKARRLLYATQSPLPAELHADRGRLRWPLLWERMGGSSLPPPSADVREEERWVEENFLPGKENSQHVKKLGGFLRGLEEEREMEGVVMARRAERRLDDVGEEFDAESDEEDDEEISRNVRSGEVEEKDQADVRDAFEKRILELFVDGVDVGPGSQARLRHD